MKAQYITKVPGKPMGKQRPKASTRGGFARMYTPEATISYENLVVTEFERQNPGAEPIEGMVEGRVISFYPIPSSKSKKVKQQMLDGIIRPTVKPDLDNIEKIIYDALNGIAFVDDKNIVQMKSEKWYADVPCTIIEINEL